MTNEEVEVQAEIYAKEKHCKNECRNIPNCWENNIEDCCTDCRKTNADFIAGAKWGMEHAIEWHDLRKCPDDLPKVKGEYWTKYNDCNEEKGGYYDSHYYDPDNSSYKQKWYKLDVIAWCELPQYKEKE